MILLRKSIILSRIFATWYQITSGTFNFLHLPLAPKNQVRPSPENINTFKTNKFQAAGYKPLLKMCLLHVSLLHRVFPSDRCSVSVLKRASFGNGRCEYRIVVIGQVERWKWTWPRRMEQDSYWQRQTDELSWHSNTETRRTKAVVDAEINIFLLGRWNAWFYIIVDMRDVRYSQRTRLRFDWYVT